MSLVARFGATSSNVRRARCTADEQVGHCVYVLSGSYGGVPEEVRRADPVDYNKLPVVGVIINKINDTECEYQVYGETPPIYSGLADGEIHFLGWDSKPSDLPPSPGGVPVFTQTLGWAVSDSVLFVKPSDILVRRKP